MLLNLALLLSLFAHTASALDVVIDETALNAQTSSDIVGLREENVKHFDMGNGVYQAIAYSHPVHELDENGVWQDIDFGLTLTAADSGRVYANEAAGAEFAERLTANQPLFTLSDGDCSVSMTLRTASAARAAVAAEVTNPENAFQTVEDAQNADFSSSVLYEDVLPGVDLEYVVDPGTVKENIIVKERAADYSYAFTLNLAGLSPVMQGDGSIVLCEQGTGAEKYAIPAPFMYDALGNCSEDVSYTLSGGGSTYTLTVTANADWINALGRAFPVTIDPTCVTYVDSANDTYTDSDEPDLTHGSNSMLWVRANRITYIRTPSISIPSYATLDWAYLTAFYYYFDYVTSGSVGVSAHRILTGWNESTLTWNNASGMGENFGLATDSLDAKVTYASIGATYSNPKQIDFAITDTVRGWLNGTYQNCGIGLKYVPGSANLSVVFRSSESSSDYRPRITYTYHIDAYYSALKNIYGFASDEADMIMGLYSRVNEKYGNSSIYARAWISSRLLGGLVYDNDAGIRGDLLAIMWKDVAGQVYLGSEEIYYQDMLEYTVTEYTQLKDIVVSQHNTYYADKGDFAHMQISLAARLAYYLDIDGLASNVFGDDETISYMAGWLGDAALTENGTTSFGNDDYIADLDAENIYRQILLGKSILQASTDYYTNLSSTTRAQIFTSYISYETVKAKIYYQLIDKELYTIIASMEAEGNYGGTQVLLDMIEDEAYHVETIKADYPDTYNFICSIRDLRNTIGDYS